MQDSLQLKITPYPTPLFLNCSKGTPLSPPTPSASYLLLPYTPFLNPHRNNHICRTLADHNKQHTLIQLQGECLHKFVLSKLNCVDRVMDEPDVWGLVVCLCQGFYRLEGLGVAGMYRHFREYCVRRVERMGGYVYKLIYHEDMISQLELARSGRTPWHTLYLSPEQLTQQFLPQKSIVFSFGLMLLHLCSNSDRNRSIYKKNKYEVDPQAIKYKLGLAKEKYGYSKVLLDFVGMCLELDGEKRVDFGGLWQRVRAIGSEKRGKYWQVVTDIVDQCEQQEQEQQEEDSPTVMEYKTKKQGKLPIPLPRQMVEPSSSETEQQEQPGINRSSVSSPIHRFYHYEDQSDNEQEVVKPIPTQMKTDKQLDSPTPISISSQPPQQTPSPYTYTLHSLPIPTPLTSLATLKLLHCLRPLPQLIKQINKLGLWTEGDIYYGDLVDGKRQGLALQIYANQEYYYGYFEDDLYSGEGLYLWTETEYFFGRFQGGGKVWGRLEGQVKYQGQFKDNKRHGTGTCWYPSGQVYSGQWQNGKRHGQGFVIEPEGPKFVGIWQQGKRKGQGYLETPIMRIAGYWNNEQIEGETLIEYSNGDAFKGTTNSNLQRVEGDLISSAGEIFKGTFQGNQPKLGKLVYRNGDYYIGELAGMRRHGYGQYHYSNGQTCKGIWQANALLHKK